MKVELSPWSVFKWLVFVSMLVSLDVWFFWWVNKIIISIIVTLYCLAFFAGHPQYFKTRNNILIPSFIFVFLAFCFGSTSRNLFGWIGVVLQFLPAFFVILLNNEKGVDFFNFTKKILSIILLVSCIGWVLYLIGVPLPHSPISFGNIDGEARYYYDNYYVFLDNLQDKTNLIMPRFSSVFTEPGYLGCILSAVLFSENFKFRNKQRNYIFLLSLVLSFSLAGWMIGIIGFIVSRVKPSLKNIVTVALFVFVFLTLSSISRSYNNGNNVLYQSFFARLEFNEMEGRIEGYNRSGLILDDYFFNNFIHSDRLLFGEGEEGKYIDLSGAVDWKAYLIRYGLISGLFILLYYLWPSFKSHNNKFHVFGVSLIFLLIAIQTSYGIFSCMYISLFALCVKSAATDTALLVEIKKKIK